MLLTEIKIAAIYSVSNRGFLASGLLMKLSAHLLTLSTERFLINSLNARVLKKHWSDLFLSSIISNLPPQSCLLGYNMSRVIHALATDGMPFHMESVVKGWVTRLCILVTPRMHHILCLVLSLPKVFGHSYWLVQRRLC